MNTRPALPGDRALIARLLGTSAIDAAGNHIVFAEDPDGSSSVIAVWHSPPDGGIAELGAVVTIGRQRRDLFYQAILQTCEDAIAAGHTEAHFTIRDSRLVARIKHDFNEIPEAYGRNVMTGKPNFWQLTVNLQNAATKLRNVLQ